MPITVPPSRSRNRSTSVSSVDSTHGPSAPPLPTIDENEEELVTAEVDPLLSDDLDNYDLYDEAAAEVEEDDMREFEAGMAVSDARSGGKKVNCCDALLKQCLELIDLQATTVLASEDVEDLDISAVNMIVCRETLCLRSEVEVFEAIHRWTLRECKRQRLELTSENKRRVLEGAQYLVRYLTMTPEVFEAGPATSGLLTREESDAILANIKIQEHHGGANNIKDNRSGGTGGFSVAALAAATVTPDLPDHLLQWHNIMRKPRRGREAMSIPSASNRRSSRGKLTSPFGHSSSKRSASNGSLLGGTGSASGGRRGLLPSVSSRRLSSVSTPKGSGRMLAPGLKPEGGRHHKDGKEKFNFIEEFFICLACIFD